MHCARCVRSNFSSSLAPSLSLPFPLSSPHVLSLSLSLSLARARSRPPVRVFVLLSVALSRPLCPFVLSSPRLPVYPPTSDNYCSQLLSLSLSLPSISRFFPMATSSLKAASSTSRSAGIQPSMRGRVVPSCREHAVLSSSRKVCACAAFIPSSLIRPSLSFAGSH